MSAIWFLDRGSALIAYGALWLATLTGIVYSSRKLGWVQRGAKSLHVPASVIASVTILVHSLVGLVDMWRVLSGAQSAGYSNAYFVVGNLVGLAALIIIVTSIAAFVDPRKFERPWDPKLVHAFAYAGFVFTTIHAVALGTDFATFLTGGGVAACVVLLWALGVRLLAPNEVRVPSA